jgi:hypothetical protein
VTGKADPETVNPVPVTEAELTVTGPVPVDVNVIACVEGLFSTTLPNDTLDALMLNVAVAAFNCRAKLFDIALALAVSVTV